MRPGKGAGAWIMLAALRLSTTFWSGSCMMPLPYSGKPKRLDSSLTFHAAGQGSGGLDHVGRLEALHHVLVAQLHDAAALLWQAKASRQLSYLPCGRARERGPGSCWPP